MGDFFQFFSLRLFDLLDVALRAPLWKQLSCASAVSLSAVMIATFASSSGERLRAILYVGLGLIVFVAILHPADWRAFFG